MLRIAPYALIWLLGLPFLVWLMIAPRVADQRYWQVDAVDVKLGSTQVFNPVSDNGAPKLSDAAKSPASPLPVPPAQDTGLASVPAAPNDGVKINVLNPDLQENGLHGPMPKIAADGRAPWQYYARPFPAEDTHPRLAIIMKDMGLSESGTKDNIDALPGTVTFAFSPYADNLAATMQSARDRGHETLLELPLEVPPGSPVDVGPRAISAGQTPSVNQDNFFWLLSNMLGSVGTITDGGQRMMNNETMLRPLMQNLQARGLLMVDDTQQNETLSPLIAEQLQTPWARSMLTIDANLSQDAMDVAMGNALDLVKKNGRAVVVIGASPLARSVVANWSHKLEREGVVLAPISAVATVGAASQASAPPLAPPAPAAMQAPAEPPPAPESSAPDSVTVGPIDLLNPKGSGNTSVPNILDPSKPAAPPAPLLPSPSPAPTSNAPPPAAAR